MSNTKQSKTLKKSTQKLGGWMPHDLHLMEHWLKKLMKSSKAKPKKLIPEIAALRELVYADNILHSNVQLMFWEAYRLKQNTPLDWQPEPIDFEQFLVLLNEIMYTAPEAYQTISGKKEEAAGMIGFPINALLAWPMATSYGYDVFSNALINQQFKKILKHWSKFLVTPESRYTLIDNDKKDEVIAWLSPKAQQEMLAVAKAALGAGKNPIPENARFADVFKCNPKDNYYGYKSWDDFFTRVFCDNVRPVSHPKDDSVIVNACESAPYRLSHKVKLSDKFWLKGQPYSLENMLNFDELAPQFEGGTVYQAFLSALSFHRWHSPVSGTIRKGYIINGTYYLESLGQGFYDPAGPDAAAPNNSQGFLTAVATRAVIFIEADNPEIGLMCVMPVGMAEVSSCEITVKDGDHVNKGDQLGMFHFGGSTHCLIFRKGVKLAFKLYGETPSENASTNIRVNTEIARVVK